MRTSKTLLAAAVFGAVVAMSATFLAERGSAAAEPRVEVGFCMTEWSTWNKFEDSIYARCSFNRVMTSFEKSGSSVRMNCCELKIRQ